MFTPIQAIEAIKARISSEYDNPQLLKAGDLRTDPLKDIEYIVANTRMEPVTKVLFLYEIFPDGILAIFPEQTQNNGMIACYSRKEQHATASKGYAKMLSEAKPKDYQPSLKELTGQGYNLEILNKTGYKL